MDLTQKLQTIRGDLAKLINRASLEDYFNLSDSELADYVVAALKDLGYGGHNYTAAFHGQAEVPTAEMTNMADQIQASQFGDDVRVDRIASGMAVPLSFRYVHKPTGITHTAYTIRAADRLEPGEEQRVREAGLMAIYTKVLAVAGIVKRTSEALSVDMQDFGGKKVTD